MSSREVRVADIGPYLGKWVSAEYSLGWGEYWYTAGVLTNIEPSGGDFYLDFCEYPDDCEDCEPGNHGAIAFPPDATVRVHVGGRK